MKISSDSLIEYHNSFQQKNYQIHSFFYPFNNEAPGGDRFGINFYDNHIAFYIADASGHGEMGTRFWNKYRQLFDQYWLGDISSHNIRDFMMIFNNELINNQEDSISSQLCLCIGTLSFTGELYFANFGYGTHLLASSNQKPWKCDFKDMFGLKLGWCESENWDTIPRAYVSHCVANINRIILMTDCFLGDDYANPMETLMSVNNMNEACCSFDSQKIIPYFLENYSYKGDDASIFVIDQI